MNYLKFTVACVMLVLAVAVQAQGTCYGPPPIERPGTVAVCVCDSGGFSCRWVLVSTRY